MFIFLSFSCSLPENCVAPHKTPPPVNNMKPLYAQVLLRHGARAPIQEYMPRAFRGSWTCDSDEAYAPRMMGTQQTESRRFKRVLDPKLVAYLPNCRPGDLLVKGMTQHKELGDMYNQYLNDIGLIDGNPSADEIYARCTDVERTFRSAEAFLYGLAPPVFNDSTIKIVSGNSDMSLLKPQNDFCAELAEAEENFTKSEEYSNFYNEEIEKLSNLLQYFGKEKTADNLVSVCDLSVAFNCNDKQLPSEVTDENISECKKVLAFNLYDKYKVNPFIYTSYTFREILRQAKEFLKDNKVKFSVNSAHDSTVAALYSMLGGADNEKPKYSSFIPPFASHLLMEIWEDANKEKYIRFAFNGEEIPLKFLGSKTLVKYTDFLKSEYMRVYDYCKDVPF